MEEQQKLSPGEHPKSRRLVWVKEYTKEIIVGLVLLIAGGLLTRGCDIYNNRLTILYYGVTAAEGVVDKTAIGDPDLRIMSGIREVENISTLYVAFSNPSSRDLDEIPVVFTFDAIDGRTPVLLRTKMITPPEKVESVTPPKGDDKSLRVAYKMLAVNRETNPLLVQFVFEGPKLPTCSIRVPKAGIELSQTTMRANDELGRSGFTYVAAASVIVAAFVTGWQINGMLHDNFLKKVSDRLDNISIKTHPDDQE